MYTCTYLESGDKEIYLYMNKRSDSAVEGAVAPGVGVSRGSSRLVHGAGTEPTGFAGFAALAGRSSWGCRSCTMGL